MPLDPLRRLSHGTRFEWLLLIGLVLLAGLSVGVGAVNGIHRSQDFQWSGAHVLAQHQDPWRTYLDGDPQHQFVLTQVPNYLPILYALILPLGFVSLTTAKVIWVLCNLAFALASGWIAARFYGLRGKAVWMVICLLLIATATRNSIGNGQQGLLVLLIWCVALLTARHACLTDKRAVLAGVSYFKFTFLPPLFLFLLLRMRLRAALLSLLPIFAGPALLWLWLTGGHQGSVYLRLLAEPFAVARTGFTPMAGDLNLMNMMDPLLVRLPASAATGLELIVATSVFMMVAWLAFRRKEAEALGWQMALMATMSYVLFKHHPYDAVVLLLPLCCALPRWREIAARVVLAGVGYLFFAQRAVEEAHLPLLWLARFDFILLMVSLVALYQMGAVPPDAGKLELA